MVVDIEVEHDHVVDCWITDPMFRGFEPMLKNRYPQDAVFFTQRICGICSSAHALASVMAVENAYDITPASNGIVIRNLISGADFLQNHLRHFYVLVLPDYIKGPDKPPFRPLPKKGDFRIPKEINDKILEHFWEGIELSAKAHQMMALFGSKAPHQQTIVIGGCTQPVTSDRVSSYKAILGEITKFVKTKMLEDSMIIAKYYPEYYQLGVGYKNLLSFGLFAKPNSSESVIPSGVVFNGGDIHPFAEKNISEEVTSSWYDEDSNGTRRPVDNETIPNLEKTKAYSWIKTPLYQGEPIETGPLARLWIKGEYQRGISTMDRIIARSIETSLLCDFLMEQLELLVLGGPTWTPFEPKLTGEGSGLTEAMRGALGHWVKIKDGVIENFQIITPSAFNFAPRSKDGRRGPGEQALIGTPVETDSAVEIARILHSFDPCFSCSVHVVNGKGEMKKFVV